MGAHVVRAANLISSVLLVVLTTRCVSPAREGADAQPAVTEATDVAETPGSLTLKAVGPVEHRQRPCQDHASGTAKKPSVAVGVAQDVPANGKKPHVVTEYDCGDGAKGAP